MALPRPGILDGVALPDPRQDSLTLNRAALRGQDSLTLDRMVQLQPGQGSLTLGREALSHR